MKSIFTLLTLLGFYNVLAQGPIRGTTVEGNTKITGTVIDSLSQKPVEFATVALANPETSSPIDGAVCDEKGKFTINKVAVGRYKVIVSFIGFETKTINVKIDDKKDDIDLGTIIISPTPKVLKEITVEGQKAIIEERVDRTVYNAENDVTARGGDATDVLKRVPLLSVDLDGNVSMRGNQNVKVLINNKPSTIMASSIADALKQIPADMIKSVEVITSPSAKYDAEGSAGIINIITKKNNLEGLTLNINSGVGLRGANLGLNGNYRKGKMGFSLGGFGRANYNIHGSFNNRQITRDSSGAETIRIQEADTRNRGMFGNYQLGWDYDINKHNYIAASVRYGLRNGNNFQDGLRTTTAGTLVSLTDVEVSDLSGTVDVDFAYTRTFEKPQKEFSVLALYSRNNRTNDFENINFETDEFTISNYRKNENQSYNQEITVQLDYQTPISTNQMVEFGAKDIMRKVSSDYQYFEAGADGNYFPAASSSQPTNVFNYDQNVTSGYFSYTYNTSKSYSFKAGARYEYTTINANFADESDGSVGEIPSYGVLVPSINVSKKLKNGNTLKASYNKRIQRPSIQFLNPNIQQPNRLDITVGNPNLGPEYTDNYELAYSTFIKGTTLNFSGFLRNTYDAIQSVREPFGTEGAIRTTYQNIGHESAYGLSVFANVNIGNKLSLNGGADTYYAILDNNNPDPQYASHNEGWVVSGRMFGNYNFNKGWGLQFFSFFRGNQVQLQGKQGGFRMYSLGVKKDFNEKRGSVGLAAENFVTPSIKIKGEIISQQAERYTTTVLYNMGFRVNFSYRIGKMSFNNQPRRRKSVSNDDLKDGGGNDNQGTDGGQQQQRGTGQMPAGQQQRPGTQPQPQRTQNTPDKTGQTQPSADTQVYEAAGKWTYTIDAPQGGDGTIVIKKENGIYSGTIKTNRMTEEAAITGVSVNGNNVSFSYPMNFGGNSANVEVKYSITKNDIQGTMSVGQFRTFNLVGERAE